MGQQRFRIFISSPGDVGEERVLANNLARRLSDEFADRLWIEPVFWEHEPLNATATFQTQLPPPHECEVAVCILWSRLGTRLPPDITRPDGSTYASGTEFEFEDAAASFRKIGKPELLVYRKLAEPFVSSSDTKAARQSLDQKDALDEFINKWFINKDGTLKAAFHCFKTASDFEKLIEEHLRRLILRSLPQRDHGLAPAKIVWSTGSPFRGLDVFEFDHSPIFFGRTRAIGDVLNSLRTNAANGRAFLLIVGISGGGKSSLVRAGVLPMLVQPGVIEGISLWRRAVLKPSDDDGHLFKALAASLLAPTALPELAADGTTIEQLAELLHQSPTGASGLIKGGLSQAAATLRREQSLEQQPEARLVIVVDQLEEIFTSHTITAGDRQEFIAALSALSRGGKAWVIATLRGDFYQRAFDLPELVSLQEGSGQYALPLPTAAEIAQMIRQPAAAAGLTFEVDARTMIPLDEVLRDAAAASPESLPLLEFALDELYQLRTADGLLTYAAYETLGGVEGALNKRAEDIFDTLPPAVQQTLPRVLRSLVNVSDGDVIARRQAPLPTATPTPESKALVEAFVQARLFSASNTALGEATINVTHEALLRGWPRVQSWLRTDRELLIIRSRVSAAAGRWSVENRRVDLLLPSGRPIEEARKLQRELAGELTPEEVKFIDASGRRIRINTRLKRVAILALIVLTCVASLTAVYADRQRQHARANATEAQQKTREVELQRNEALHQKSVAQARFDDIKTLANTFLFDLNDKIENLAGSTPARYLLVRTALDYLQKQQSQAEADQPLLRDIVTGYQKVANVQWDLGENDGAIDSDRRALQISQSLVAANPTDNATQRDLEISFSNLADKLNDMDKSAEALVDSKQALAIAQKLLASLPNDSQFQTDFADNLEKVGNLLADAGDPAGRLKNYQQALQIRRKLASHDLFNASLERDLSLSLERTGILLTQIGDNAGARDYFQQCLNIRQILANSDPNDSSAQRDLSIVLLNLGHALASLGDTTKSLNDYQRALAIARMQAGSDPTNVSLQHDLCNRLQTVAEALGTTGDITSALDYYNQADEIAKRLLAAQPTSNDAMRDEAGVLEDMGDAVDLSGDKVKALSIYQQSVVVRRHLVRVDDNDNTQRALANLLDKVGQEIATGGDQAGAIKVYQECVSINQSLVAADPSNADYQRMLSISFERIGIATDALGDHAAALLNYLQAEKIRAAQLAASPADPQRKDDYQIILGNIASAMRSTGDDKGALARYQQQLALLKTMPNDKSGDAKHRLALCVATEGVAACDTALGDKAGAADAYRASFQYRQQLAAENTADVGSQRQLWWSYFYLASALSTYAVDRSTTLDQQKALLQEARAAYFTDSELLLTAQKADRLNDSDNQLLDAVKTRLDACNAVLNSPGLSSTQQAATQP